MATFKPGDRVVVPWGLDEVTGTVLSLFGPPGKQFARVEIELQGGRRFRSSRRSRYQWTSFTIPVPLRVTELQNRRRERASRTS